MSNSDLELIPKEFLDWSQLTTLDLRGNQLYCTCDLHNITAQLQDVVKRDRDAAYCFDYKRYKQYKMYSLTEEICFEHVSVSLFVCVRDDNDECWTLHARN